MLPKYINSRSLADLLNSHCPPGRPEWSYQRVQNILKRMGIAQKMGGAVVFEPSDLAGTDPGMYELLLEALHDVKPSVHGHTGKHRKNVGKSGNIQSISCKHEWDTDAKCKKCGEVK